MSFADDLRAAEKRLKKLNEEEKTRKTTKKKSAGTSSAADWTWENEIIALFLYLSKASKFIKENYSKKRKISPRAMTMRMAIFEAIHKGKPQKNIAEQTQLVFDTHARLDIKELQGIVVSILRGEYERPS